LLKQHVYVEHVLPSEESVHYPGLSIHLYPCVVQPFPDRFPLTSDTDDMRSYAPEDNGFHLHGRVVPSVEQNTEEDHVENRYQASELSTPTRGTRRRRNPYYHRIVITEHDSNGDEDTEGLMWDGEDWVPKEENEVAAAENGPEEAGEEANEVAMTDGHDVIVEKRTTRSSAAEAKMKEDRVDSVGPGEH
jgi:hypothetical protein